MARTQVTGMAVALVAVLAGCSTVISGHAQPADHDGPVPVPKTAMRHALLDADELDKIMDAAGIERISGRDDLSPDSTDLSDTSCLAAWRPIQKSVYDDSGWKSLRGELLYDNKDAQNSDHFVVQAVVGFSARSDVTEFFDKVKPDFESCGDRHLSSRTSDGLVTQWDLGAVDSAETTLSVTRTQQRANGWGCQRALRATNNVVVDVLACSFGIDNEAVGIVDAIDAKLPSV